MPSQHLEMLNRVCTQTSGRTHGESDVKGFQLDQDTLWPELWPLLTSDWFASENDLQLCHNFKVAPVLVCVWVDFSTRSVRVSVSLLAL